MTKPLFARGYTNRWLILLLVLPLVACSGQVQPQSEPESHSDPGPQPEPSIVSNFYGPAPELTNEVWLNTATPLRLADLRGNVVLIDMWTFG